MARAVSTVSKVQSGWSRVWIQMGERDFFSLQNILTSSGDNSACYSMGTWDFP